MKPHTRVLTAGASLAWFLLSLPASALTVTSVVETGLGADAIAVAGEAFGEDSLTFSDRTHEHNGAAFNSGTNLLSTTGDLVIDLPSYLVGNPYVRFANDARENAGYSAVVSVDEPAIFYLLVDNRLNGPAGVGTKTNTTDPVLGGSLQWVIDGGWERMNTGISPDGQGDFTGVDEAGDGTLNQFYSVYRQPAPAGQVTVRNNGIAGQNMISLVAAPVPVATEPITSFAAQPAVIVPGESVNLSWLIAPDATSAVLNPGGTDVLPLTNAQGLGALPLTPQTDGSYTLQVTTPTGSETETVAFTVRPLASYAASSSYIDPGETVTLSWFVRPDAAVSISGLGDVSGLTDATGHGTTQVSPPVRTTYTLTAEAGANVEESSVTIVIRPAGQLYALLDLGALGGRPETGAADDLVIGAGVEGTNATDLPATTVTATDASSFTVALDGMDRFGSVNGGLDWRDRGDSPGVALARLAEDHVKNNAGTLRVVLGGLPAGSYTVTAYTLDVANSQSEQILIFASDALGEARDTGVVADASYPDHPANTNAPNLGAKLTTALVDEKGFTFPIQSNGTDDVILYFDGTTATDIEVPLAGLAIYKTGAASPLAITQISRVVTGQAADVSLEFPSTPGATYRVETSPDLSTWTELTDNFPVSGAATTIYVDPNVPLTIPRRYYRVTRN